MLPAFARELPDSEVAPPAAPGSFDSAFASLREANSPLRMTAFHRSLPVTRTAGRDVFHAADVVLFDQGCAQGCLIFITFVVEYYRARAGWLLVAHVEDFAAGAQIFFGRAVAAEAPFHLQALLLVHQRHLVDGAVAGVAADSFINVNAVVEINEVGELVHARPLQRFAGFVAGADRFEELGIGPDLGVAVHARLGRWNAGEARGFD